MGLVGVPLLHLARRRVWRELWRGMRGAARGTAGSWSVARLPLLIISKPIPTTPPHHSYHTHTRVPPCR